MSLKCNDLLFSTSRKLLSKIFMYILKLNILISFFDMLYFLIHILNYILRLKDNKVETSSYFKCVYFVSKNLNSNSLPVKFKSI